MTFLLVFVVAIAMVPLVAAAGILALQTASWVVTFTAAYREAE